jgi:hypothetical protein
VELLLPKIKIHPAILALIITLWWLRRPPRRVQTQATQMRQERPTGFVATPLKPPVTGRRAAASRR